MGIFDNLSKFGIKNMDSESVFKEEKEEPKVKKEEVQAIKVSDVKESDFIFAKSFECPVCASKFQSFVLKSNKARLIHSDKDLRPIYEMIEPIKYEVISCPVCGYSAMNKYLAPLAPSQKKAIVDNISTPFTGGDGTGDEETVSFQEALDKITLALACAMIKRGKASEKAYICLKGGWLCRSYREALDLSEENYTQKVKELEEKEDEFLKNAYEGFVQARATEQPPIAGMDDITISYILAYYGLKFGQYDVASKMVASILQSPSASSRVKDRARELKEELIVKIKEKKSE